MSSATRSSGRERYETHCARWIGPSSFDGFQLDDELALDEKVEVVLADDRAFVFERHRDLSLVTHAAQVEFSAQGRFVDTFVESGAEDAVDFDGSTDDMVA